VLKYKRKFRCLKVNNPDYVGVRYIVNNEDFGKFEALLASNMTSKFKFENNKEGLNIITRSYVIN